MEGGADDSPYGSYGDGLDTTVSIAEPASKKGTEESARKVVHCDLEPHTSDPCVAQAQQLPGSSDRITHNTTLKEWLLDCNYACCFIKVTKAHDVGIVAVAVHAAHDTLIISKEENGEASYHVDKDQKRSLLVLASYIVALDVVHGCYSWPARVNVD